MKFHESMNRGNACHDPLDIRASILIIENGGIRATAVRTSLQVERYAVEVASNLRDALDRIEEHTFDLLILDLSVTPVDGFELLRRVRERDRSAMVLALSMRDAEVDKVQAFQLGADDYVVTPVGSLELIARVGALLRRVARGALEASDMNSTAQFGRVIVDRATRTVTREHRPVGLTPREFDLLAYLLDANGRIVTRQTMMRRVWRYSAGVASRTVDQHIARLRMKIEEDPLHPVHLLTVRKSGYRLSRVAAEPGGATSTTSTARRGSGRRARSDDSVTASLRDGRGDREAQPG